MGTLDIGQQTSVKAGKKEITRSYRTIRAWQLADQSVIEVYQTTSAFPREELYGLVSQMRRAATSVAANIVEGTARGSKKEYLQFLFIARGSLAELGYYLDLSCRLHWISKEQFEPLDQQRDHAARVLHGLIQSVMLESGVIREVEPQYAS